MSALKRNLLYQTLYQILVIALPLATAPYISRVLGAEKFGIFSYSNVVATYFVVVGMLGLEQYGNRCISRVRDNYEERSSVFSELITLHALISVIVIMIYVLYVAFLVDEFRDVFVIQGIYVLSLFFDVNWFFFGMEKYKLTVIRNTIIKVSSVLSVFLFVKNRDDLNLYCLIIVLSIFFSQISLWPLLKKYVKYKKVQWNKLYKHMRPMIILFIAVIAANLNRMIDKVMLGWYGCFSDLGQFDYADKLVRVPLSFIAALGTVMLSKMSYMYVKANKAKTDEILDTSAFSILVVSIGMAFIIAAVSPEFVVWFLGDEFTGSSVLLCILTITIPLVAWDNFVRTQILIPKQLDYIYTSAVCSGAIVNIIANIFLIYYFGAKGAAISSVISYFVIMTLQTYPVLKLINLKQYMYDARYHVICGVVTFLIVRACSVIFENVTISLFVQTIVGFIIYGLLSYMYIKKKRFQLLQIVFKK